MDVVVWLRGLGLGKYEAAFRENEIDEAVLPSLTHENLKELGVTALGHRLKLLDAIAALRANTSAKATCVHATTAPSAQRVARAVPNAGSRAIPRYRRRITFGPRIQKGERGEPSTNVISAGTDG